MRVVALDPESILVGDEGVELSLAGRDSDFGPTGTELGCSLPLLKLFVVAHDHVQLLRIVFLRTTGNVQGIIEPGAVRALDGESRVLVYHAPGHHLEIKTLNCAVLKSADRK